MNTSKEIYALDRILDLLEEKSFGYLAVQDSKFSAIRERLYRDVSHEITKLQHY